VGPLGHRQDRRPGLVSGEPAHQKRGQRVMVFATIR
jgi:hypothetical protein